MLDKSRVFNLMGQIRPWCCMANKTLNKYLGCHFKVKKMLLCSGPYK